MIIGINIYYINFKFMVHAKYVSKASNLPSKLTLSKPVGQFSNIHQPQLNMYFWITFFALQCKCFSENERKQANCLVLLGMDVVILPSCVIKEDAGPPTWVLFCLSVCTLYNESSSGSHHLVLAPAGCAGPAPPHNYTYNSYFSFM